jgi:hypothetical protein
MLEAIKRKALYYAGLIVIRYRHRRVRGRSVLYSAAWALLDLNDLFWYELVYGRLTG